ncbi:hypothetical protein Tco_1430815 [Tanacetum coccineum]
MEKKKVEISKARVDERIFPTVVAWRTSSPKDGMLPADSNSSVDVTTLTTRRTLTQKQLEVLLCLVGLSRNYFLGDDVYPTFLCDNDREMDLFNLISAPNPLKVKTGIRPHAAHEVPLLTVTASRVIEMEETGHATTAEVVPKTGLEEEVATMGPPVNKRQKQMRRKRVKDGAEANAPPKVLRKNHVSSPATGAPTVAKSVSNPDPLSSSRGTATEIPAEHVSTTEVNVQLSIGSPESGKSTFVPSVVRSPGGIYQPGWGVTNDCRLDTSDACQDMVDHIVPPGCFSELRHLPNADFLSQYNINLARQVAMGS